MKQKGSKVCSRCKKRKKIAYFQRDITKLDGFRYECKSCSRIDRLKRMYDNDNEFNGGFVS